MDMETFSVRGDLILVLGVVIGAGTYLGLMVVRIIEWVRHSAAT